MRVLLIKMSSMGDVFHALLALNDAIEAQPGLVVDWVVEEAFAEIPAWHPAVNQIFPIALRRWRKNPFNKQNRAEIKQFFAEINQQKYDLIIDAQALLKGVWVTRKIPAPVAGLDWNSVREPLASWFYDYKYPVAKGQHAITRLRQLFAQSLDYPVPETAINHRLQLDLAPLENLEPQKYLVFLHGTTWETKYWPENYWQELIKYVNSKGYQVVLPWGNDEEKQRSERLAQDNQAWLPTNRLTLNQMASVLKHAKAVVTVDTGLSNVAAALETPTTVIYRVTDPKLIGAQGPKVTYLCSPLAPGYIKKFKPGQEQESLQNISVQDVIASLGW